MEGAIPEREGKARLYASLLYMVMKQQRKDEVTECGQ